MAPINVKSSPLVNGGGQFSSNLDTEPNNNGYVTTITTMENKFLRSAVSGKSPILENSILNESYENSTKFAHPLSTTSVNLTNKFLDSTKMPDFQPNSPLKNDFLTSQSVNLLENKFLKTPLLYNRDLAKNSALEKSIQIRPFTIPDILLMSSSGSVENRLLETTDTKLYENVALLDSAKIEAPAEFDDTSEINDEETPDFDGFSENGDFPVSPHVKDLSITGKDDGTCELKSGINEKIAENNKIKTKLLNYVSAALVSAPNLKFAKSQTRVELLSYLDAVVQFDPEFILKIALYARLELNIRTISNFLLAYSAYKPNCRKYLRKYFSTVTVLPSDWTETAELYATFVVNEQNPNATVCSLPAALRKVMFDKFPSFDEYQLAKHDKGKNLNRKTKRLKKRQQKLLEEWKKRGCGGCGITEAEDKEEEKDSVDEDLPSFSGLQEKKEIKFNIKRLIRQLHIKKPAEIVMSILGKKYPQNAIDFQRSGLLGVWNERRSGERKKLKIPQTWETQLSKYGNKAEVWQRLLDERSVPFMAMLRNLRNIIKCGVAEKYHNMIINRLEDEKAVINSKQFPFRFFSAFSVMDQLMEEYNEKKKSIEKAQVGVRVRPKGTRTAAWWIEKNLRKKAKMSIHYDETLINRYRKALDKSVKIATRYNVKPIAGRTVVFCSISQIMHQAPSGRPPPGKPKSARTLEDMAVLLSLMCKYVCENCQIFIYNDDFAVKEVHLIKGTILENMNLVLKEAATLRDSTEKQTPHWLYNVDSLDKNEFLEKLYSYLVDRTKLDNILLFGLGLPDVVENATVSLLDQYRRLVNERTLFINVGLRAARDDASDPEKRDLNIRLSGFTDQILRFLAERGSSDQLKHAENIDESRNLNLKIVGNRSIDFVPLYNDDTIQFLTSSTSTKQITDAVRIFISSTFKDMHSERSILLRYVFPELQRRARDRFGVNVYPIDLRWGITESQAHTEKSINLCLQEVAKCQIFVGLLGERYGYRPSTYSNIKDENGTNIDWMAEIPSGQSVTELEIRSFALRRSKEAKKFAYFYFRQEEFLKDIPEKYVPFVKDTDEDIVDRLRKLKREITESGFNVYNYPCCYAGFDEEFLRLKSLQSFAHQVLNDLWTGVQKFMEENEDQSLTGHIRELEELNVTWRFAESESKKFVGRHKQLDYIERCLEKSADVTSSFIYLVTASNNSDRTGFLAKLSTISRNDQAAYGSPVILFKDALVNAEDFSPIDFLYNSLRGIIGERVSKQGVSPTMWTELMKEMEECGYRLLFILDAVENMQIDSILEKNFLNCTFIISAAENSALEDSLLQRKIPYKRIHLPELEPADRASQVRSLLSTYGKALDESPFNNQMRILMFKRHSNSPTYLKLACDYLRLFGTFEKLNSELRMMQSNFDGLIMQILKRIESDHELRLTQIIILWVTLFNGSLSKQDLYLLTSLTLKFEKREFTLNFDKIFEKLEYLTESSLQTLLPYYSFLFAFNAISPILIDECRINGNLDSVLIVRYKECSDAVKKLYGKNKAFLKFLTVLLTGFLNFSCDPLRNFTFAGNVRRHFVLLPRYLALIGEYEYLFNVLTNLNFVRKCFIFNITQEISAFYGFMRENPCKLNVTENDAQLLKDVNRFIMEKSNVLCRFPQLFYQELYNEPQRSRIAWNNTNYYDTVVASNDNRYKSIIWRNKPVVHSKCYRTIRIKDVTCLTISNDQSLCAFGAGSGKVILMDYHTSKEIFTFIGHTDAISAISFITKSGTILCSCTKGGAIFVWNTKLVKKIASLAGHSGTISACRPFSTGYLIPNIITAGWDCRICVWQFAKGGKLITSIQEPNASPINCLDCHPDGLSIVFGQWDGNVMVYDALAIKRKAVLRSHVTSVQMVAYHSSGLYIVSSSSDGCVKVWSSKFACQLGSFFDHESSVSHLLFNDRYLTTAGDSGTLKVWSPLLGSSILRKSPENPEITVNCATFSLDGGLYAIGYSNNRCSVYKFDSSVNSSHLVSEYKLQNSIVRLKFFANDNLLIVCLDSATVMSADGTVIYTLKNDEASKILAADCTESLIVLGHDNGVLSFYTLSLLKSKECPETLFATRAIHGHESSVTCCAFNFAGTLLVSVGRDKNMFIWDTKTIKAKNLENFNHPSKSALKCHNDIITCCAWSDSKDLIVTGSNDCLLKVWDAETLELLHSFESNGGTVVDVVMKGGCVACVNGNGSISVWSYKGVMVTELVDRIGHSALNLDMTCRTHERTANWADLVEEELESQDPLKIKADKRSHGLSSLNPEHTFILSSYTDGSIRIWKPFTNELITKLDGHKTAITGLATSSPSSDEFLSIDAGGTCKWWAIDPKMTDDQFTIGHHDGPITCAAVSEDESFICVGGSDGKCSVNSLRECDGRTKVHTWSFLAHEKLISGISLLSKKENDSVIVFAVTAGEDGHVKFWRLDFDQSESKLLGRCDLQYAVTSLAVDYVKNEAYVTLWNFKIASLVTLEMPKKDGDFSNVTSTTKLILSENRMWIDSVFFPENKPLPILIGQHVINRGRSQPIIVEQSGPLELTLIRGVTCSKFFDHPNFKLPYALFGTEDGRVIGFDYETNENVFEFKAHNDRISGICVINGESSPENYVLCTVSYDKTLKLWKNRKLFGYWQSPAALTFVQSSPKTDGLWCGDISGSIHYLSVI